MNNINVVEPVQLTKQEQAFLYQQFGTKATTESMIPISTPMSKCQRPLYSNDIKKYIRRHKGLNWDLFGVVTAVKHKDGTLEVINGQHRMTLAKTILPDIKEVPAHIITLTDEKDAYRYFGEMNGGSTRNITAEEKFYAEVLAEDPEALAIRDLLIECGLSCGEVNKENAFAPVKYASFKKCFDRGHDATKRAAYLFKNYVDFFNDNCFVGTQRWLSLNIPKLANEYEAIDHSELLDPNSRVFQTCEEWFKNKVTDWQLDDYSFKRYRAHSDWSYGIALGLTEKFCHYARKYHKADGTIRVRPLQKFYNYNVKGGEFNE